MKGNINAGYNLLTGLLRMMLASSVQGGFCRFKNDIWRFSFSPALN